MKAREFKRGKGVAGFDEDRPQLGRIKALALVAYRKARDLATWKPSPGYPSWTRRPATIEEQLFDLRRASEAADELAANLSQRIRALEFERDAEYRARDAKGGAR